MVSTTRCSPTICASRLYAQLIDSEVITASVLTPRLTALVITKGSEGLPGLGSVHGAVPSMTSFGCTPACSAAARMNNLMLEPVWRGTRAMFTSLTFRLKPRPPTMTRTAPDVVSSDTMADAKPWALAGNTALDNSAIACSLGSIVV